MDKLFFKAKEFVIKQTKSAEEYQDFINREKLLQGKQIEKKKNKYVNFKDLQKQIKDKREEENQKRKESIKNGTLDKKKERKKAIIESQKKAVNSYLYMQRHGAPNDVGRSKDLSKNFKSKAVGGLGDWKNGALTFTNREIERVTGKNRYK